MWTLPCAQPAIRKRWLMWVPGGVVLMAPQVLLHVSASQILLLDSEAVNHLNLPPGTHCLTLKTSEHPVQVAAAVWQVYDTPGSTPQEETTPRSMCSSNVSWVSLRTLCLAWQLHGRVTYMPHSPQGWQVYIDSFLCNQNHLAEEDPDQGGANTVLC